MPGHVAWKTKGFELMRNLPLTFAIVGAPKAGTTSLATYLSMHPQVFMCHPKEPFIFGEDLRPLRKRLGLETATALVRLFRGVDPRRHVQVGEASTLYLSSSSAIDEILRELPHLRAIVMLRHPIDLAYSFHGEMVSQGFEPESDFERAWDLQDSRLATPEPACPVPRLLQYRDIASIGTQVSQLVRRAPRGSVCCVTFDDFVADPEAIYAHVCTFLGLADERLTDYPVMRQASVPRIRLLSRALVSPLGIRVTGSVQRVVGPRLTKKLRRHTDVVKRRRIRRPPLSEDFRNQLRRVFDPELLLLKTELNVNLSQRE